MSRAIVNGETWQIIFISPSGKELMRSDGIYTLGVTDRNTNCIYLNNRLSGRLLDKVLCHELVHTFCFSYGIYIDIETEELMADFMATYGRDIINVADNILFRFAEIC